MSDSDPDSGAGYVVRRHYAPTAPEVLVVVFGVLGIALDGDGLHIAILDPRTIRKGNAA